MLCNHVIAVHVCRCVRMFVYTVPLNCTFIFTYMISHGATTILQCSPVICLHGPHVLVLCNVHVSHLVEAHSWKVHKTRMHSHVTTCLPSLSHYITPIFCWLTGTMSRIVSSVGHI